MTEFLSIFNHALAPVTPGPSSSNTCGPVRIANLCKELFGEVPKNAYIEFPKGSAFPATYIGMRSDIAFINGLMGKNQNDPDFIHATQNAKEAGLAVSFDITDFPYLYSETVRLTLTGKDDRKMVITGASTGGGTCEIFEVDGLKTHLLGDQYALLLFTKKMDETALESLKQKAVSLFSGVNDAYTATGADACLVEILSAEAFPEEALAQLTDTDILKKSLLSPVHPVVRDRRRTPPFRTPEELEHYAEKEGFDLFEAAVQYEMAVSGWTREEVLAYGQELFQIIDASATQGIAGQFNMNGIVSPKASLLQKELKNDTLLPLGFLETAVPISLGVMEYSNASGKIVCLPTGGSSGIVPGAILGAKDTLSLSGDDCVKALLAAGMVGVLMADDNNFSGGDYGCQAEVGCGTAMAASALVQIMHGSVKQAMDAASMALQCQLGLICDPVAGLVQVPCLARNMAATAIAAVSANTVLAGFDVVIPFRETTQAMIDIGKHLPEELKGCGGAGCCNTKTGVRLAAEQEARDQALRA